ncbi:MAG: cyanophycin synthetase, partial [Candidatus Neomarinimicrobiota bacterium]|nr:cyanophycin synthetase [Candidatus Neomarinimicrobiota bacterium]
KEMSGNNGRLYVVFGAGGDRDKTKRPEMARIAELFAHHCFITPDNPRTEDPNQISKDVSAGFEGIAHSTFMDREMGLRSALDQANAHDIVAVLGKGREEYQEIMGQRIFYSDIKIIREYQ